ncbi:MFS transporter [Altericroceibacterium spongiae]|uniref:MFS transporter n=2 Tax=Altericroceibacterium spongiae TaxID=2320269 RepID=A0A420EA81_9SPHN|nr:MFS transporter [Altericroceibacterium spongiae]
MEAQGTATPDNAALQGDGAWPPARQAWSVAALLMAANSLAFVDRQALAFLIEPIKQDIGASDTAMGFAYGLGFTLLYIGAGIPLAWLADRSNRRNIVLGSIVFWSMATSACGLARNYASLFAARVAVGAGEAGLGPASYSLLSDYFPREKLASAMGLYQSGIYIGGALALLTGGWLAGMIPLEQTVMLPVMGEMAGWQVFFLLLGLPGLLLAGAIWWLIAEPARRGVPGMAKPQTGSFFEAFTHMRHHSRAYFGLMGGFMLVVFVGNGTGAWIPAFLAREYGMAMTDIGNSYGLVVLTGGLSGSLSGGVLASRQRSRGSARANLIAPLIGFTCLIPVTIGFPLMPTPFAAIALIGAMNFFAGFTLGGGLATILELTPNHLRAQVSMIYVVAINILGGVMGPLSIALLTDYIFQDSQRVAESIATVSAIASPLALVALLSAIRALSAKPSQ